MNTYIISGTTMKERALLEYNHISYRYCSESYSNFPIKDIEVHTEHSLSDILKMMGKRSITVHSSYEFNPAETEESVVG